MPPLFPWFGIIRSRVLFFICARAFSISHILLSLFFFYFPLYASTLPSVRGYTLPSCCFSTARVRFPFLTSYYPSSSFISPYMPSLSPRLGVIRSQAAVFSSARVLFSISPILLPLFFFLSLDMPLLSPRLGVIRLRAAVFHLRKRLFHFSSFVLPLLYFSFLQTCRTHVPKIGQTAPDRSPDARARMSAEWQPTCIASISEIANLHQNSVLN